MSLRFRLMTTPASAIKDEVRVLIDVQIETFRQPAPITSSQLREYHYRSEKLRMLPRTESDWHKESHRTSLGEDVLAPRVQPPFKGFRGLNAATASNQSRS